jgi:hypothetical protein
MPDDGSVELDASTRLNPATYIETRLAQYQSWYDKKAVATKRLYLRMRTASVVSGAVVPVLVNVQFPLVSVATTILSLLVVTLVSLESVYHFREQWKNYRSTEQLLGHERVKYEARVGPYEGLGDERAFATLVERVESAIAAENASTLNTMTLASENSFGGAHTGRPV